MHTDEQLRALQRKYQLTQNPNDYENWANAQARATGTQRWTATINTYTNPDPWIVGTQGPPPLSQTIQNIHNAWQQLQLIAQPPYYLAIEPNPEYGHETYLLGEVNPNTIQETLNNWGCQNPNHLNNYDQCIYDCEDQPPTYQNQIITQENPNQITLSNQYTHPITLTPNQTKKHLIAHLNPNDDPITTWWEHHGSKQKGTYHIDQEVTNLMPNLLNPNESKLTAPQKNLLQETDETTQAQSREITHNPSPQNVLRYAARIIRENPDLARSAGIYAIPPGDIQNIIEGIQELLNILIYISNSSCDYAFWERLIQDYPPQNTTDPDEIHGFARIDEIINNINQTLSQNGYPTIQ